jgi:hypothetical protein
VRRKPSIKEPLGADYRRPYPMMVAFLGMAVVMFISCHFLEDGGALAVNAAWGGADVPRQGSSNVWGKGIGDPFRSGAAPIPTLSRPVSESVHSAADSKPAVPSRGAASGSAVDLLTENRLTDIRAGRHHGFVSIVFEFTAPIDAHHFRIDGNTLRFTLGNTRTGLKPYRAFNHIDLWVRIRHEGADLDVALGLPAHVGKRRTLFLTNPQRLVLNLYDASEKADGADQGRQPVASTAHLDPREEMAVKATSSTVGFAATGGGQLPESPPRLSGKPVKEDLREPQVCDLRQMDLIEARILSRRGLYEKALRIYERLRERYPDDEGIWVDTIETLVNYEAYELALLEIRKLLSKNPTHLRGQRILTRIYQELNQPQWTFPLFEGLLDDYETDVGLWSDYAGTRLDSGDWAGALNYYCRVLELDPDNESALQRVHEILRKHRPQLVPGFLSYYQEGDDSLIQTFSLGYARDVGRKTRLNVDYQQVRIGRPDQPSTGYGRVQETLHDLTALIRHRLGDRWQADVGGSLYSGLGGGPSVLLAVDYEIPRRGVLRGSYVYHRPWFDPVEAAAREGNFNQARISLDWALGSWWSLLARGTRWDYFAQRRPDADASRYGERHAFLGILTRRLMAHPAISLSYSYYLSSFHYQDATFRPIDMMESERIHTLSFNFEDQPCTYLGYGLSGGIRRHTVKQTYSWFAFPFIKLRLGNRIDAVLSYEYSSEANTPQGGTTQTLNLSARIFL